ncbi:N-acetyltransferase family protein [Sphingomonas sp. ID0503]|uniref:GNAT family N-acetyltransferase n=1 Tax=Sphingomonas sp. ID0503 TaxID=3399691 RepID=UPI003AFB4458
MTVTIRRAVPGDEAEVLRLIQALAEYEHEPEAVEATEESLRAALFGNASRVFADLAEIEGRPVGLALWFFNFSTWTGKPGLYLEDFFVDPEERRAGIGRALFEVLARNAVDAGCARMEWAVLDWNRQAMDFYRALGAIRAEGWQPWRLTGQAMTALAGAAAA